MSEVGFMTMGRASGPDVVPAIGVGMPGHSFMGDARSNGYRNSATDAAS